MVKCEICGDLFRQITTRHLQNKHQITPEEYLQIYPGAALISTETRQSRSLASTRNNSKRRGVPRTEEVKAKMRTVKAKNPRPAWNKGIPMQESLKKTLSEKRKKQYETGEITHWNLGRITSDEVRQKISTTLLSQNLTYSEESKRKRAQTYEYKKEQGWVHPWSTDEGKIKNKQVMLERHGVENSFSCPVIQEKIKSTCLERYGVDNPLKSVSIRENIRNQWQERAGVSNPMASKDVWVPRMLRSPANTLSLTELEKCYDLLNNKEWLQNIHHNEQKTLVEIGEFLGLTYHTIGWFLRKHEIEIKYYFSSRLQDEITAFITNVGNNVIQQNIRNVITPYEIDIFLPNNNIGFEINGIYWHSELAGVSSTYHTKKTERTRSNDIHLIHIFENEWTLKQDIVKSKLRVLLGVADKIAARKCTIQQLTSKQSRLFFEQNHIQGYVRSSISYGLFYENKLVAAMSFGQSRFNKSAEYEMLRFASILNTTVVGGASKLFKHFIRTHSPKSVISYCDLRWGTGKMYEKLEFEYSHTTRPNYFYFKLPDITLYNRIKFQKHKLPHLLEVFDPKLTEWENMANNGWNRIWDCGNSVWLWTI